MKKILTPTRGGEASKPNQDRAIQLAKEQDAELYFLYIADVSFLDRLASPVLVDMEAELSEMGEFVLAIAQERAAKQGVDAKALVQSGVFSEVIATVIEEHEIDTLILGSPEEETGITTREYLTDLSEELGERFDLEILLLSKGEIVYEYRI
ncbi:MAG: universal stress protein [Anaerolineales bacterium]|jgi:nucleotide-binding universal stress UspA family protein